MTTTYSFDKTTTRERGGIEAIEAENAALAKQDAQTTQEPETAE